MAPAEREPALVCDAPAGADTLYHMCPRADWEAAKKSGGAYFPKTFAEDGNYTHATAVASRLITTANHFYTTWPGDWICLVMSRSTLLKCGIVTKDEPPRPVGEKEVAGEWSEWVCPHIFGGIPQSVVSAELPIVRDAAGTFLSIQGV
jgi:uncharacterized protein (DUF952 family)